MDLAPSTSRAFRAAMPAIATALLLSSAGAAAHNAGQADTAFGGNENGLLIFDHSGSNLSPMAASTAPDGAIYFVGSASQTKFTILRTDEEGHFDPAVGIFQYHVPEGFKAGEFRDIEIFPDGSAIAAGRVDHPVHGDIGIACKLGPDGDPDMTFAAGSVVPGCVLVDAMNEVYSVTAQSDKSLLLGGNSQVEGEPLNFAMVRVGPNGTVDHTFANGSGIARLPEGFVSHSKALQSVISADGSITTLADDDYTADRLILARHTPEGVLDKAFSDDGAMIVAQHVTPAGLAVDADGSIVLAVVPVANNVRTLHVLKFRNDGNPAPGFQWPPYLPPGEAQVAICDANCITTPPYFSGGNNLFRTSDNRLTIGTLTYYPETDSVRPIALRIDSKTGMPDPMFGDMGAENPIGVGHGIALPGNSLNSPDQIKYFSVLRGDRLTVIEHRGSKIAQWAFLGDRLLSDSFE